MGQLSGHRCRRSSRLYSGEFQPLVVFVGRCARKSSSVLQIWTDFWAMGPLFFARCHVQLLPPEHTVLGPRCRGVGKHLGCSLAAVLGSNSDLPLATSISCTG